ncbi:hypothetical protein LEP1GSC077_4389 [Leptospira interrogans str. C10069]|nr:hypothetical protein LEP1GSC077_4389 [Leptospira interrogans str. C10069]
MIRLVIFDFYRSSFDKNPKFPLYKKGIKNHRFKNIKI